MSDVKNLFNNGADKVLLNSSIFKKNFTEEISEIYGEQSISIMIDYLNDENKEEKIMINCGTKFSMNLKNFFNNMYNIKFGEIIFNSIENDGTGNGLDLSLIKKFQKLEKNLFY